MEHQELGQGASHHSVGVTWASVGAEGLHQVRVWLRSRHVQSRVVQGRHLGLIFLVLGVLGPTPSLGSPMTTRRIPMTTCRSREMLMRVMRVA